MLNGTELNLLFSQVFGYPATESGHRIGFLVDIPSVEQDDSDDWRDRRHMVMSIARTLVKTSFHACLVYAYEAQALPNADLVHPVHCIALSDNLPDTAQQLATYRGEMAEIDEVYSRAEFWVALTQHSATIPLKRAASRYGFKAITSPGFKRSMTPALTLDNALVDTRITRLSRALTRAHSAIILFDVAGQQFDLTIDLRYRMGFATTTHQLPAGQVAYVPSGEAYIAPYEGEKIGVISLTGGILPIEKDGMIALCEVAENRIVCIDGDNDWADALRSRIFQDPACANIAELGLGILGQWGIDPVQHPLFDEKLSLHIALGRSDLIGGVTSPADFISPASVSHTDYIFHHKLMPNIRILRATLCFDDVETDFIVHGKYLFDNF